MGVLLIAFSSALPAEPVQIDGGSGDSLSRITIGPATPVSTDDSASAHAESFLAVNPRDTRNLIAAAIVVKDGHFHSVAYASFDGGRSWSRSSGQERDLPFRANWSDSDPVVYFDGSGTAFFGRLVANPRLSVADSVVLLSRSRDGGRSWEPGVLIPVIRDREYFAFDHSRSAFRGRMYAVGMGRATWLDGATRPAVAVGYSDDGGHDFGGWHTLLPEGGKSDVWSTADPVVTPDGILVIPYLVLDATSGPAATSGVQSDGVPDIRHGYLMTVVSADGGQSFSAARPGPAADLAASPRRFLSSAASPRAAVDLSSGPHRGRIYLTWMDYSGGHYAVRVAHSDDTARTWSQSVIVNDNDATGGDPATPAIAVNKHGVVGVVWNDRRGDAANRCYQLYFAASVDGGETFRPNVRLSAAATCPADAGNSGTGAIVGHQVFGDHCCMTEIALTSVRARWPNGGDTQGLVADSAGVFHVAGIEVHSGTMQLIAQQLIVTAHPVPMVALTASRSDLSKVLTLEVTGAEVDFASRTSTIRLRVVNPSRVTVNGPFTVLLDEFDSRLSGAHVANADNGLPGRGATWLFTIRGDSSLPPGAKSDERVVAWQFASAPHDIWSSLLHARFRIFGARSRDSTRAAVRP